MNEEQLEYWTLQLKQWQYGANHFTARLLDLIAKADLGNQRLIAKGFPEAVQAYKMFMSGEIDIEVKI